MSHFKVFIEFVAVSLLFYVWSFGHRHVDLSLPTRLPACEPTLLALERETLLNRWTAREVPPYEVFNGGQ